MLYCNGTPDLPITPECVDKHNARAALIPSAVIYQSSTSIVFSRTSGELGSAVQAGLRPPQMHACVHTSCCSLHLNTPAYKVCMTPPSHPAPTQSALAPQLCSGRFQARPPQMRTFLKGGLGLLGNVWPPYALTCSTAGTSWSFSCAAAPGTSAAASTLRAVDTWGHVGWVRRGWDRGQQRGKHTQL